MWEGRYKATLEETANKSFTNEICTCYSVDLHDLFQTSHSVQSKVQRHGPWGTKINIQERYSQMLEVAVLVLKSFHSHYLLGIANSQLAWSVGKKHWCHLMSDCSKSHKVTRTCCEPLFMLGLLCMQHCSTIEKHCTEFYDCVWPTTRTCIFKSRQAAHTKTESFAEPFGLQQSVLIIFHIIQLCDINHPGVDFDLSNQRYL